MLNLTLKGVEVFMNRSKTKSQESFWDNYDLIIWKKDSGGYTNIKGMFRKDSWVTAETISVDDHGIWKLPLLAGQTNNEYGVWGGIYLSAGSIDTNKNIHKTPDVWKRLKK